MQERWLALDVGEKRIGVAVSDPLGLIAQPVGLVERIGWGPDIKRIAAHAEAYQTRRILVGLPRNMDGSCGAQAEKTRAFAAKLAESGFEITFWDERLSTRTAERALIEGGVRRAARKTLIDQTAAVVILQAYLDANQNDKGDAFHGEQ